MFRFVIILRFFIRFPIEINNKMIDPFFTSAKYSLPAKEVAEKNTLLAYGLLINNMLLRHEYM